jgi:hypothetical protein
MIEILEDVYLTDTTVSYQVSMENVDLEDTLDQSYERHRAAINQDGQQPVLAESQTNGKPAESILE